MWRSADRIAFAIATVLVASRADAQQTLTEDALVAAARASNPELRARRWDRSIAEGEATAAAALDNPVVRLEWLHAQEGQPTKSGWGVGLSWTPPQPTVLSARKKQGRAHTSAVEQDVRESGEELELVVRTECATVEALGEALAIATHAVEVRKKILAVVAERVEHGVSTRLEASMATLSVARAEQARDAIAIQRQTALTQLAATAGFSPGAGIELAPRSDAMDGAEELPSANSLEERAMDRRPQLRADAARAEQTSQVVRAEKARRWPWISFQSLPRFRVNDQSSYKHDLAFGVDVTVPIFDTNAGRIAAAESEQRKQEEVAAAHRLAIRRDVDVAREEVVQSRIVVRRYKEVVEPALADHAALVRDALQGRQVDLLALLTAEDVVLETQRQFVEATLFHRKALLRLARASGDFSR